MKMHAPPAISQYKAFSLVEVTLAMGIFVFALVSMLGLLSAALQSSRASLDISAATQVADAVAVRLSQGNWSEPVYFDDLGNETNSPGAIYQARVVQSVSVSDYLKSAEVIVTRGSESADPRHFTYLIFDQP